MKLAARLWRLGLPVDASLATEGTEFALAAFRQLTCRAIAGSGQSAGRQSEIECRSRPGRRLHPHSTAMPLDGLPAECESQSVPGVLFSVQALEHLEYAVLECRVYAGTVVLHREHPFEISRVWMKCARAERACRSIRWHFESDGAGPWSVFRSLRITGGKGSWVTTALRSVICLSVERSAWRRTASMSVREDCRSPVPVAQ